MIIPVPPEACRGLKKGSKWFSQHLRSLIFNLKTKYYNTFAVTFHILIVESSEPLQIVCWTDIKQRIQLLCPLQILRIENVFHVNNIIKERYLWVPNSNREIIRSAPHIFLITKVVDDIFMTRYLLDKIEGLKIFKVKYMNLPPHSKLWYNYLRKHSKPYLLLR
jgi:hypothetical protein